MSDIYSAYGGQVSQPDQGPPAGMRTGMILHPPGGMPSMTSQYKDFDSGANMGQPMRPPTDLGHPGRGPPGQSRGWQNTEQEFREQDANYTMDHMKQHQDMDQSQRNLELNRQRYNNIEAQKNEIASKRLSKNGKKSSQTTNALLLVAMGLLALLIIDAFLKMRKSSPTPSF